MKRATQRSKMMIKIIFGGKMKAIAERKQLK